MLTVLPIKIKEPDVKPVVKSESSNTTFETKKNAGSSMFSAVPKQNGHQNAPEKKTLENKPIVTKTPSESSEVEEEKKGKPIDPKKETPKKNSPKKKEVFTGKSAITSFFSSKPTTTKSEIATKSNIIKPDLSQDSSPDTIKANPKNDKKIELNSKNEDKIKPKKESSVSPNQEECKKNANTKEKKASAKNAPKRSFADTNGNFIIIICTKYYQMIYFFRFF